MIKEGEASSSALKIRREYTFGGNVGGGKTRPDLTLMRQTGFVCVKVRWIPGLRCAYPQHVNLVNSVEVGFLVFGRIEN